MQSKVSETPKVNFIVEEHVNCTVSLSEDKLIGFAGTYNDILSNGTDENACSAQNQQFKTIHDIHQQYRYCMEV